MDGFRRQATIVLLLDELKGHNSWCGETHIQKSVYFWEEGLGAQLGLKFVLYKHGPFSFDLREELGEMRGNLLIELESHPPYGPSVVATESGRRLLDSFASTVQSYRGQVDYLTSWVGSRSVAELERLSTALYVYREKQSSADEQANRITELKPHISIDKAEEAVRSVREFLDGYQEQEAVT